MIKWVKKKFTGVLSILGLYYKEVRIAFLGLENAGKTTLMRMLVEGKYIQKMPTHKSYMKEVTIEGLSFQAFDLDQYMITRYTWKDYCIAAQAIIFLVDASSPGRFGQAKEELDRVLSMPELVELPIAILGNKIDRKGAVNEEQLREALGLSLEKTGKTSCKMQSKEVQNSRPIEVFMCSIANGKGYKEAFQWLNTLFN